MQRLMRKLLGSASQVANSSSTDYNSRSIGDSTLLVSFCNVRDRSKPVFAAIDLRRKSPNGSNVKWIDIKEDTFVRGTTGLCFWENLVCVAHQGSPGTNQGFVLLDPNSDFEQVSEGYLPATADIHSVCCREGDLYFVASRRDSVYRATFDRRSRVWKSSLYWTFPKSSGEKDENHFNAIENINGELYISGFGRKENNQWSSTTEGFIYNLDREEYVIKGIYHPHSLLEDYRTIWVCESAGRKVISNKGEEYVFPVGYIRGLAMNDHSFYVGSSKRRKFSDSVNPESRRDQREYEGICCIYNLKRNSGEPEVFMDLSEARNEIYELALI